MGETCRVCGAADFEQLCEWKNITFWFGEIEDGLLDIREGDRQFDAKYGVCNSCGFIGMPLDRRLKEQLARIYKSECSNPAPTFSDRGFGRRQVETYFDIYRRLRGEAFPASVLEVGCQGGFLLNEFRKRGASRVLGFEPGAIPEYVAEDGYRIPVVHDFFTSDLTQGGGFEFATSVAVFEHVESPVDFAIQFQDSLADDGHVLHLVPNEYQGFLHGNPGVIFLLHINLWTPATFASVMTRAGLSVVDVLDTPDLPLSVAARRGGEVVVAQRNDEETVAESRALLMDFRDRLDQLVNRVADELAACKGQRVGLYGGFYHTSNLLSLLPDLDVEWVVFDSDPVRWGKEYSGLPGVVHSPDDVHMVDAAVVVPFRFQTEIEKDLRARMGPDAKIIRLFDVN